MLLLKAVIMGLVEGLTEFLPVSSTGHLILAAEWLRFEGALAETFEVVIQPGAILAVCWHYRLRLAQLLRGWKTQQEQRFVLQLMVAVLPALLVGFFLHGFIKAVLFSPSVVAAMLVVGGFIILWVEKKKKEPRILGFEEITYRDALLVGMFQAVSVIPGTSRSGATIIGGLILGMNRRVAAEFSFFLAIPTMFAASSYDLWKNRDLLAADQALAIGVGFAVSFLSGLLAIRLFLAYVSRHDFVPFAIYRILFGGLMLWWFSA